LPPRAAVGRRPAAYLPVRGARRTAARAHRARRRGAGRARGRAVAPARRPAQRAARTGRATVAAHRDVLHRRLRAMAKTKTKLTHVDAKGRPAMVDVSAKPATAREAVAECRVRFPAAVAQALRKGGMQTGK